jgi:Zn-dependent M28 family amino/carboxypeptidase
VSDPIPSLIRQLDGSRLRESLYYLAADPLPFRKVNYTLPGHDKTTLDEADDYLQAKLEASGYLVEKEGVPVQAFRCDVTKPKSAQYSPPEPGDPWYTAYNLYARKPGTSHPDEIIVVISHKDSQSWVDSPGANDNAVGTVANLEIARVLAGYANQRSLWFVYCNEEHTPWTSVTAAQNARQRGDNIVAVFNLDSLGRKSQEEHDARIMANETLYTTPEGERLADLMAEVNDRYGIGLRQRKHQRPGPGDDDGSFVNSGYGAAIVNLGSYPYADPEYHTEEDKPDRVDLDNALLTARATLAAIVATDQGWLAECALQDQLRPVALPEERLIP